MEKKDDTVAEESSNVEDISALIQSVMELLCKIADETAKAQQDMEKIKDLLESQKKKDDLDNDDFDNDDSLDSFPPGRPLPDFPNPYPDPQPGPFNDPRPAGPSLDQEDSPKE
jgi:hypothetical protein